MTKVVFETATFADAIKHADKIAPSKGVAFDKAAGIVIEVDPNVEPSVTIRATNTDVFYREWVDTVSIEGEATVWRLPSSLLATMAAGLPIGSGREVTLEEVTQGQYTHLTVKSGKMKARFNLMSMEFYPGWDVFDPDDLEPVEDLGGRISMAEWAADKSLIPFNGICFTKDIIVTTDRYRLVRVPMKLPEHDGNQIVIPAGLLGQVLKQTGTVRVGFTPHQMLLMPNDTTQLRVVRFDTEFPDGIHRLMETDRPDTIEVNKSALLDVLRRTTAFSGAERNPVLRVIIGKEEIAAVMDNADVGAMLDIFDVPGQATHKRHEIKFTPKYIMEALEKAPNDKVSIGYDTSNVNCNVYIDGGSGYECWVVPQKGTTES